MAVVIFTGIACKVQHAAQLSQSAFARGLAADVQDRSDECLYAVASASARVTLGILGTRESLLEAWSSSSNEAPM